MTRDIDIALLRAFVAVVETGSVTNAARLLNRTQAAVSQQIKRLEDLLDMQLFRREHRKLELAAPGEQLLSGARKMLALNDDVWGVMTTPAFEGEIKIGVPDDIVMPFMPSVLKSFNNAWPQVQVSLLCGSSPNLRAMLKAGDLDLTLTTEPVCGRHGEKLLQDRLVWVGAKNGQAHMQQPLPVSLGSATCAFRPSMIEILTRHDRNWRMFCQNGHMEAQMATVEADLAVTALLTSTVPESLEILDDVATLPDLPIYYINIYLPPTGASDIAVEFARQVRSEFTARFPTLRVPSADAVGISEQMAQTMPMTRCQ